MGAARIDINYETLPEGKERRRRRTIGQKEIADQNGYDVQVKMTPIQAGCEFALY